MVRLYRREGLKRLGLVLGCASSIAWIIYFAPYFRRVYTVYYEFPVVSDSAIDAVARRLSQQTPISVRGSALADRAVADGGFRQLTRNQQIAVLEYLEGVRLNDFAEPIFLLAHPKRIAFSGTMFDRDNQPDNRLTRNGFERRESAKT